MFNTRETCLDLVRENLLLLQILHQGAIDLIDVLSGRGGEARYLSYTLCDLLPKRPAS